MDYLYLPKLRLGEVLLQLEVVEDRRVCELDLTVIDVWFLIKSLTVPNMSPACKQ